MYEVTEASKTAEFVTLTDELTAVAAKKTADEAALAALVERIENISLDGITFGCNEEGMYGMCRARELIFFTTRGGVYGNGPLEQGARYLEALCGMFGIPEFRCICAEGIDARPEQAGEIMARALKEAREAGESFWGLEK